MPEAWIASVGNNAVKRFIPTNAGAERAGSLAATLTVAAIVALMVGVKTVRSWDKQAIDAQMSHELIYRAAQQRNPYPPGT
jgi:hypothetical protein